MSPAGEGRKSPLTPLLEKGGDQKGRSLQAPRRWLTYDGTVTTKRTLTIEYDERILSGLGLSPEGFSRKAALLLAAKLYEMGRLSSGQAAELCGMPRVAFLYALPGVGVKVSNLTAEDADEETAYLLRSPANARRLLRSIAQLEAGHGKCGSST